MIYVPKLSQLPYETLFLTGVSYGAAHCFKANPKLASAVTAISIIANYLLFKVFDCTLRPHSKIKSEAIYTGTNAIAMTMTILVSNHLKLISKRMAGVLIAASVVLLATRIKILSN